ncbi:MAG: porin family protein [Bacteroidaceae bacterium]|nr:porin family protein [Bacteroidaceae bacterium]
MKKILSKWTVAVLLLMGCSITASAQRFRWGVNAGADFNHAQNYDNKLGYQFGLKAEYGLPSVGKGWYLDGAVNFSKIGWKDESWGTYLSSVEGTPNAYDTHHIYSMFNYDVLSIHVPIHIGYKFDVVDNIKLFVSAGPYMNFKLRTDYDFSYQETVNGTPAETRVKPQEANAFTWGLGAKAGVELGGHVQLYAGYDYGFRNLMKNDFSKMKQRTFSLGASYLF